MFYYVILNKLVLLIYSCSCHGCWSFYCFGDSEGNRFLRAPVVVTRAGLRRADLSTICLGSALKGEKSKSLKKAPEVLSGTISIETSPRETGSSICLSTLKPLSAVECGTTKKGLVSSLAHGQPCLLLFLQVCSFLV